MSKFYHVIRDCYGKWIKSPNNGGECCTTQEDTVEALNQLIQERDALQAWKNSAMAVEREWDEQAIAIMLGVPLGQSTRKGIAERVPQLIARVTTLQCLLDQRWEMMRELEEVCETKDVAKAVEYVKGLKTRVNRLEDALGLVLKMRNDWLEMQEDGYAGAYYAFVKGNDREWDSIIKAKESKP